MAENSITEDEMDGLHHTILDALHNGRITPSYVAESTGESRQLVSKKLRQLRESGAVDRLSRGLYELADDPREEGEQV
jgi:GTP-sensing pleiotropic transcriptional regulator CodY